MVFFLFFFCLVKVIIKQDLITCFICIFLPDSSPCSFVIFRMITELQIRGGIDDNSNIFFFYFPTKTHVVTLIRTALMRNF